MKKINFELKSNEVIRKVSYVKQEGDLNMQKLYVYKMLQVLDNEGLLSRGYLTRVRNGHISYHTCLLMVRSLISSSRFAIKSLEVSPGYFVLALIETISEEQYEEHLVSSAIDTSNSYKHEQQVTSIA